MKNKIALFLAFLMFTLNLSILSFAETEHLFISKKITKKSPTNIVVNNNNEITIIGSNVIEVTFAQNFSTKDARVGDRLDFILNNGLNTKEGTKVLPDGTKLISKVISIQKPKSFNRSAKVKLNFICFETPDGETIPINARLFNKKGFLSRGKLNAMGKGLSTTLGLGGIGVAAGCGIGIAAGAVIVGGFAIGLPVGIALGALIGGATPGLHYKAKAGDKILIQLADDVNIQK